MECMTCHQSVAAWADFCPHCGAPQGPLGAGPSAPTPARAVRPAPADTAAATAPLVEHPQPPVGRPARPALDQAVVGGKRRVGWLTVALAGLLIVGAVVVAGWSILRVTSGGATATSATTSTTAGASSTTSGSATSPAATVVPPEALECGTSGAGDTAVVLAGANTSCEFALAVQSAYAAAAPTSGSSVSVSAHSPVTNKDYTLTCRGTRPTICVTGTATVYLTSDS